MGNEESTPTVTFTARDIPAKPVLNFREKPSNDARSTVDDALAILNFISSVIGVAKYAEIPQKILDYKEHGDNILAFLGNSAALVNLLISSQIQENDCAKVASEIKAKFDAIKERREYMLDKKIPIKDKHTHVGPAIHTCREVLSLFQDKSYTLWKVPVPASELLINFAAIYAENALVCGATLPSHKKRLYNSMKELQQTLCNYKEHCISTRISVLTCQARTYDEWERGAIHGDWVYDDEKLLMHSNRRTGANSGINFRLGDKWPSVWKNGQLACWEWNDKWGWEGAGIGPSDENIKTAINRGLEYRKQMRALYSECFDKAIKGVEDAAKKLK